MRVSWAPPLIPGGTINHYMVRRSTSTTRGWTTVAYVAGATRAVTLTGLRAGTTYYFRVAAVNSVGAGAYNPSVAAIPKAPAPTRPSAPTGVRAAAGINSVRVSWAPPLIPGGTINHYMVRRSTSTTRGWTTVAYVSGATRAVTLTGLRAGTTYYFRVAAVNSVGAGAYNPSIAAIPKAPAVAACSGAARTPGGSDGRGGCFPGPANTGVPGGTGLTPYTGPCTITVANTVIDSKIITCELLIRANKVTIRNSQLTGAHRRVSEGDGASFRIEDSWFDGSRTATDCSVDRVELHDPAHRDHRW